MKMLQARSDMDLIANSKPVTCLDPRCVPEQYLGPDIRAGVIRNAGGRASIDVIKSMTTIRSLMDAKLLMVVHHTGASHTFPTHYSETLTWGILKTAA